MRPNMLASMLLVVPVVVQADPLTLNDLKAQHATQLSADELKALMPGAKVSHLTAGGSTHYWTNEPGGQFVASSDNQASMGRSRGSQAPGTWRVADNGTYCVTLEWRAATENWCRYIFKLGTKYYGVGALANDQAKAQEFEFSK